MVSRRIRNSESMNLKSKASREGTKEAKEREKQGARKAVREGAEIGAMAPLTIISHVA